MIDRFEAHDLLRNGGRLDYKALLKKVRTCAQPIFVSAFTHPLLVGEGLYRGELSQAANPGDTLCFNVGDIQMGSESPGALRQAIYPLIHEPNSDSPPGQFTIGRSSKNDMALADYAISRHHAVLRIHRFHYYVNDLGTTNGTSVNDKNLQPKVEQEIVVGDKICFARYAFRFINAERLYNLLDQHGQ